METSETKKEQTKNFATELNSLIENQNEEQEYCYRIWYIKKSDRYYFIATKDCKEFATKSMSYDEAYKIIGDNALEYYNNSPKDILKEAKRSLVNNIEVTGTIKEPIFFEIK